MDSKEEVLKKAQKELYYKVMKRLSRNADGLIEGVDYVFNEDGTINWRKMVKREYLVSNKQRTKETDVSKLEDKDLLILLGGIKELAQIRGFSDVSYSVVSPSPDYVVATCKIQWISNFETEGKEVGFSAIGDASPNNTQSFARHYLGPIAENRSFVRCVRNFLKINIVSQEELGAGKVEQEESTENKLNPKSFLESIMKEKKISFEQVKAKLIKENFPKAEELNSIADISNSKVFDLIERLQKR